MMQTSFTPCKSHGFHDEKTILHADHCKDIPIVLASHMLRGRLYAIRGGQSDIDEFEDDDDIVGDGEEDWHKTDTNPTDCMQKSSSSASTPPSSPSLSTSSDTEDPPKYVENPTEADLEDLTPFKVYKKPPVFRSAFEKSLGLQGPAWGDNVGDAPPGYYKPYGCCDNIEDTWIGEYTDGSPAFYRDVKTDRDTEFFKMADCEEKDSSSAEHVDEFLWMYRYKSFFFFEHFMTAWM